MARNIPVSYCIGRFFPKSRKGELLAKRRSKPEGFEDSDHTHYDVKTVIEFAAAEAARAALGQLISKLDAGLGCSESNS